MPDLTWANPPAQDDPRALTRAEIAEALSDNPGRWAIVASHDRAARAASQAERINSGREYGSGFAGLARQVGSEHRVYAMRRV